MRHRKKMKIQKNAMATFETDKKNLMDMQTDMKCILR